MKRKRGHTQGLDQLGPKHPRRGPGHGVPRMRKYTQWTIHTAQLSSIRQRKVEITLSDHLFSSDEIKTKEDE